MNRILVAILLLFIAVSGVEAQKSLTKPVPIDKNIRHGKLENGMTYYIVHNEIPKDRANFYIVQNVGALMEEDNQNGLAHFLEHMAFNGTKQFPGKSMMDILERNGITFGGNINAYTTRNETVYNINDVPTDKKGLVDTCIMVLHDWANGLALETKELDAERGVITEEWRQRRNAQFRIHNKIAPTLYNNSKYSRRDVIGSLDVIKNFEPQTIKDFYHNWYRSDLQCIIISGDVDINKTEKKLKEIMSKIPAVENAKPREFYTIEDNEETSYCLATDKELQYTSYSLYIRHKATAKEDKNHRTMRDAYANNLFNAIMQKRITDLMNSGETPFLNAGISHGGFVRGYETLMLTVLPKEGYDSQAILKLMEINQDILKNGFTAQEFLMAKTNMMMGMNNYFSQSDKRTNDQLGKECQGHYLFNNPMPDTDYLESFFKKQIQTITAKELQNKLKEWYTDKNRVIVVSGPEKEGKTYLTKEQVLNVIATAENKHSKKKKSNITIAPLFDKELSGGEIVKVEKLKRFNAELWTLSNGAKVFYKYCNYNPGKIQFTASSLGGTSLIEAEDLPSAMLLNEMILRYGLGDHDLTTLTNILTGKEAAVAVELKGLSENLHGECKQSNFEELLQMMYMLFEYPRFDQKAHDLIINRTLESLKGVNRTYGQILQDSITMVMNSYSPRIRTQDEQFFEDIDLEKIERIYKDRFKGADEFTFYFVGDITKKNAKKLITKYVGSLPASGREESYKALPSMFPKGKTVREYEFEMAEPKAGAVLSYRSEFPYSYKDLYCFAFFKESLKLRFTEEIREKEGGTYGVNVGGSARRLPRGSYDMSIQFQCEPGREKELRDKIYAQINKIVDNGVPVSDFKKTLSLMRKMATQKTKSNGYWIGILKKFNNYDEDHTTKKYFEDVINNITPEDVHKFAKKFIQNADIVDITFKPKK